MADQTPKDEGNSNKDTGNSDDLDVSATATIEDAEVIADDSNVAAGVDAEPAEPQTASSDQTQTSSFPMVLVALMAIILGAGAMYLWTTSQPSQDAEIDDLTRQIAALSAAVEKDQSRDETGNAVGQLQQSLATSLDALAQQLGGLDGRLNSLETRPPDDAPEEFAQALSAMRGDLAEIGAENARLRVALDASLSERDAAVSAAEKMGLELKDLKADLADARQIRALSDAQKLAAPRAQISASLANGGGFQSAIDEMAALGGANIPEALLNVARTGVVPLPELQAQFPDAARAALSASLKAGTGDGLTARAADFIRAQLGARSVTPRDGPSADAVLSRAGAAIDAGELDVALKELDSLPEAGKQALADWAGAAQRRHAAVAAFETLGED